MTAVTSFVYPGSRILAGWWKDLAPRRPRSIWVAHLFVHRVEALVKLREATPLDLLSLFVLRALALKAEATVGEIDQRLHLGSPFISQVLRRLDSEQLVALQSGGDRACLRPAGRAAIERSAYDRDRLERRVFYFVESEQPERPPAFVPLRATPLSLPVPADEGKTFDPAWLRSCMLRPAAWKREHGFPPEVQEIVPADLPANPGTSPGAWRGVMVDRPEHLVVLFVLVGDRSDSAALRGHALRPEDWSVLDEPLLSLGNGWQETLPDLTVDPSADQWRSAWQAWCHPRALPSAEVDACRLERHGVNLRVEASSRLIERLRAARSDAVKGEAWLLAGAGRVRTACRIELVERGRGG